MKQEKLDPECICYGNWRQIVKEDGENLGKPYVDENRNVYAFFGIVLSNDDYYYGMWSAEKGLKLLSCVGNLETHGFHPDQRIPYQYELDLDV